MNNFQFFFFLFCALATSLLSSKTLAQTNFEPQWVGESSKGALLLGAEFASFTLPTGKLSGLGFNLGYHYLVNSKISFVGNLSQGFNSSQGFGFLYTNFGANVGYALISDWSQDDSKIQWRGRPVVSIKNNKEVIWGLQAGLEQYLFGGASTVYNAPGGSVGFYSKFELYDQEYIGSFSYGSYKTNSADISGLIIKIQFLLK